MNLDFIYKEYFEYIVAVVTLVLFLNQKVRLAFKILLDWLASIWKSVTYVFSIPKKLDSIDLFLKDIKKELAYNGGNTLKDAVTKSLELITLLKLKFTYQMSTSEVPMFECEPTEGRYIWVNNALCELFGLSHEEMLGFGWLVGVKESEREDVYNHWNIALTKKIPYSWTYTVVNQKSGKEVKCRAGATTIVLSNGKILEYCGFITPLKDETA